MNEPETEEQDNKKSGLFRKKPRKNQKQAEG